MINPRESGLSPTLAASPHKSTQVQTLISRFECTEELWIKVAKVCDGFFVTEESAVLAALQRYKEQRKPANSQPANHFQYEKHHPSHR
mmetsp:Transcript_6260/g.7196  ORF Transcript_6260/g.7196 Transcript_6260/m.7196 type:complete len:88 (+) Transcript_6260:136-399(+)